MQTPSIRSFTCSACLLSIALGLGACSANRTYPDPTQETRIHADEIRADSKRRAEKIDLDLVQKEREYDFRSSQIKATATRERDQVMLERDQQVQPLVADERDAKATAEREQSRIDEDLSAKLKQVDGAEADRLRADAVSRKAEIERKRTDDMAKVTTNRDKAEATARDKKATIDQREAKDLATVLSEREETQRKARADRLAIEAEATKRLDGVADDSKKRMDKLSDMTGNQLEKDRSIDKSVRSSLDNDRERTKSVMFTTHNGVVSIEGTVPDESYHRDLVQKISKIDGVVSVDDRIKTP